MGTKSSIPLQQRINLSPNPILQPIHPFHTIIKEECVITQTTTGLADASTKESSAGALE